MARPIFLDGNNNNYFQSITLVIGMFASISALVALCTRSRSTKATTKYYDDDRRPLDVGKTINDSILPKSPLRSPLLAPKKFLTAISNKAMIPRFVKRSSSQEEVEDQGYKVDHDKEGGFGEGGLWQKNILMGEKCQPLEFSGVIYYDNSGKRVTELPRSPRADLPRSPRTGPVPPSYLSSRPIALH